MAIIVCPECGQHVSQYAELCPKCEFPIKSFMIEHKLLDTNRLMMCPKCAHTYAGFGEDSDPIYIKCKFCGVNIIQTDLEWTAYSKIYCENDYSKLEEEFANKYGNNQFSQEAYKHRLAMVKQENDNHNKQNTQANQVSQKLQIKCPYCNSANTTKITLTKRSVSTYLFGLSSSKVGKQWHCNNCKSDF